MSSQVDLVVKNIRRSSNFTFIMITFRIGPFRIIWAKNFFWKIFRSSINFDRFWSIFADFEAKYLQNGLKERPLIFCICFVSILSHFWPSFVEIFQVVGLSNERPISMHFLSGFRPFSRQQPLDIFRRNSVRSETKWIQSRCKRPEAFLLSHFGDI